MLLNALSNQDREGDGIKTTMNQKSHLSMKKGQDVENLPKYRDEDMVVQTGNFKDNTEIVAWSSQNAFKESKKRRSS